MRSPVVPAVRTQIKGFRDFPDLSFPAHQEDSCESGRTQILKIFSSFNQGSDNGGSLFPNISSHRHRSSSFSLALRFSVSY
ncbi:Uncharacterized protein dnm_068780 [Desulfonema magnum]|uniref:Uncharacterized protein n=1 Tax=Desulfonema magnum TaxID=45655 RepID=A0A975BSH2_9BACT|nr:Uncharacterized protein dnm_068780 [Desulfonema magnum]